MVMPSTATRYRITGIDCDLVFGRAVQPIAVILRCERERELSKDDSPQPWSSWPSPMRARQLPRT